MADLNVQAIAGAVAAGIQQALHSNASPSGSTTQTPASEPRLVIVVLRRIILCSDAYVCYSLIAVAAM